MFFLWGLFGHLVYLVVWSIWSSGLSGRLVYLVVWSIWSSGLFGQEEQAMGNGKN